MAYWRLFYHFVWGTKNREPFINESIELELFRVTVHKAHDLRAKIFAINGMPDHTHVIAAIPPTIHLPDFVQGVKGVSSRFAHLEYRIPFDWQEGYGVFTISQRNLPKAIDYVRHQKEHHREGTLIPALERFTMKDVGPQLVYDTSD